MISQRYKNAYKEVLEIIKYLPENDFSKIPKEKIEYFEKYQNIEYNFNFDISIPLEEQNISREANAIILNLFNNYFLTESQKEKLSYVLDINEKKYQEKQMEKYSPDKLFEVEEKIKSNEEIESSIETTNEVGIAIYKQNIFIKIIENIKKFFHISK